MFGLGVLASLAVNEMCDVSAWLAARLIPVAARLWTRDPERREIYAEAWLAIVNERPGKLFKLGTALAFLGGGAGRAVKGRVRDILIGWNRFILERNPRVALIVEDYISTLANRHGRIAVSVVTLATVMLLASGTFLLHLSAETFLLLYMGMTIPVLALAYWLAGIRLKERAKQQERDANHRPDESGL